VFDWIEGLAQSIAQFVNGTFGPAADFMEHYVWLWPEKAPLLAVILLGTGLFVTLRLGFVQVRGFKHAIAITMGKYDNPDDEGDLKHYQALTTALSATVGIGNIAGVALAIRLGGPGALFWMWLTAFFGMALKFVECSLALMYRKVHRDGSVSGGPMYYIELGLGPSWKWMAMLFAGFAAIASFGGGCMNQSNSLADQVQSQLGIPTVITGLVFSALVAVVIIGGIRDGDPGAEFLRDPRWVGAGGDTGLRAGTADRRRRRFDHANRDVGHPPRSVQQRGRAGVGAHRARHREDERADP